MKRRIRILAILIMLLLLCSCGVSKPPVMIGKDSTVIHHVYKDTTIIKDSTVVIPVERVIDIAPDTLYMETSLAKAKAWADTSLHLLKGELINKKDFQTKVIWKERIVLQIDTLWKDKEVPTPYEVEKIKKVIPKFVKFMAFLGLIFVGYLIWQLYKRFR